MTKSYMDTSSEQLSSCNCHCGKLNMSFVSYNGPVPNIIASHNCMSTLVCACKHTDTLCVHMCVCVCNRPTTKVFYQLCNKCR